MLKVALTGNIASGKSAVQKILSEYGYKVLDTDVVGHELLQTNDKIIHAFCDYDVFENGKISREKLGQLVFSDKSLLEKLNSIVHPLIKDRIVDFFEMNKQEEQVFVAIPLLFETGMDKLFDQIIFVYADDNLRLERLKLRNGFSNDYAKQRINSQMPQQMKLPACDIVINNNGTLEDLVTEVHLKLGL